MGIARSLQALGVVLIYSILCAGLGLAVLSTVRESLFSRGRSWLFSASFAVGQAVLVVIWLLMALGGHLQLSPVIAIMALSGAASLWGIFSFRKSMAGITAPPSRTTKILAITLFILAVLYLLRSFGPFLQGDAVAYYLTVAREAALEGRHGISWLNYAPFFSFGFEGHFAVLFMLGGEAAVTLFDGAVAMNCLALVYVLGRVLGLSARAGLFAVLTVLSTAGFTDAMGGGKVDIASAQLGLAAIVFCLLALDMARHSFSLVLLAAFLAGVCITTKVSNALLLPVITIAFLSAWYGNVDRRKWVVSLWIIFVAFTVISLIPHFYHGFVLLGEPLLPFMTLFEHEPMPPWAANMPKVIGFIHAQRTLSNFDLALFPITWTFFDRPWMGGNISPMYLAFLPLGVLVTWPARVKLAALMALAAIAAWIIISPFTLQTRYHFVGLMILAVVVGHVIDHLLEYRELRRPIFIALVFVTMLTLGDARKIRHALPYIAGTLTREQYFEKYSWLRPSAALGKFLSGQRESDERAYLTRSSWYYAYFMDDATLQSSQRPHEALVTWKLQWNTEAWQYVYARGFRLIMASKKEAPDGELTVAQIKNAPPLMTFESVFEDEATVVYRLGSSQARGTP